MTGAPGDQPLVAAAVVICTSCGFTNAPGIRFCGGCGTALEALASAAPEAERRHVCVLFCDLVGSTLLSQRLDAEDLRELIDAYQRVCGAVVLRHDGFVAQYLGDGIVIYFGYPHAHEDDSSRVVRCALEMLDAVALLASDTKVELQVRIGVHSGRVVVGSLGGSGRSERLAIGDTPNIAARVQGEAGAGEVVVSESLWRLMPATFAVQPMGRRLLKGVERPMELYRVVAEGGQAAGLNIRRTPFIGRVTERERVRAVWERATAGVPQFALLRGEPGIGKSRLLEVVREEIARDNTDVLEARCTPFTTDSAFHPFIELISSRLGFEGVLAEDRGARLAARMTELGLDAAEAVPLLAEVLSVPIDAAVWPAPDLSPVRSRQRTMDLLIAAFHGLARLNPVLLVVEDLHWADPSSLELLRQMIVSAHDVRLMALLTARPEFKPTWTAATNLSEIELEALDSAEAETLIRRVANDKPLPPDVVWKIRERATGNPLFLEEITRSVTESGALVEREDSWAVVGTLSDDVVPASMEASLMARIDRLGEARSLLQLGATLGREFSHELLAAVAPSSEEAMLRHLDVIIASGLVYRSGHASPIYTFKHALVRDTAYDSLLRSTRQRHHSRIAEVLVGRFPEVVTRRPELLAHHLSRAGFFAEAAAHWQAAGESAVKRSAVNEAVSDFRRALADLEHLPEDAARMDRELSVLTALAPVLMAVYGFGAPIVGDTCTRAIDLAIRLTAHDRMYAPMWALWANQFVGGRLREGMETAAQVLAMALSTGQPMLEVTGRHATSYTRYYRAEYDVALEEAEAGLRHYSFDQEMMIAEIFQLSSTINILTTKGSSLWMMGRQDEGIAVMNDMLALARSLKHPPSIAGALAFQMFFALYDRDWSRLYEFADETYDLSRAEGFAMWTANAGMHRGRARVGLNQVAAGLAEVLEWAALFRQTGSGIIEGSTTSMASEALHMSGRSEEALVVSADGERRAYLGMVRVMEPEIYRTRGDILRDLGRVGDADAAYRRAVTCARAQRALSLELRGLTSLLDLHANRGQTDSLSEELRRALSGMMCSPDRPDLVAARELLARIQH
ncbi:MAG: adenylate/guanylate cyclase domain-containing protein [bacterium]